MKKHLMATIAIAIATTLLLVACGGTVDSSPSSIASPEVPASEQPSSAPTETASPNLPASLTATIDIVDSKGDRHTITYADLFYRYYWKAEASGVLVFSWENPSEINANFLTNFFEAQANWNQTSWDSTIVYLPQEIVEDYVRMYFDVTPEHIRQAGLSYEPEQEAYQIPMYSQEYPCAILSATSEGNLLTIYYETYNDWEEDLPVWRQGHVTIEIVRYPHLWKYVSNENTFAVDF